MNTTRTAIAVALALVVVVVLLIFPGLSPFGSNNSTTENLMTSSSTADSNNLNLTNQTSTTTMPTDIQNAPNQLEITDETIGTGSTAEPGDTVTVNYVGSLMNGTVFDASANHGNSGFTFTLGAGQVIKGWDEGIVGMKVGGKRKLVIPPSLAYGSQSVGNVIPANSTLIFEVELLKVEPAAQ